VLESVGGVDAARRIRDGERCDVVVLADDVMLQLAAERRVDAAARTVVAVSATCVAVPEGAMLPDVSSEASVREAVLEAPRIALSTGPSGTAVRALFDRWGIATRVAARIVEAPPGVPVGRLVAMGQADLGFQQRSELLPVAGVRIVGELPVGLVAETIFAGAVCATAAQPKQAREWLAFLAAPASADAKRRYGMQPASA
jgi:molybdate transport system substrate-binding protein